MKNPSLENATRRMQSAAKMRFPSNAMRDKKVAINKNERRHGHSKPTHTAKHNLREG